MLRTLAVLVVAVSALHTLQARSAQPADPTPPGSVPSWYRILSQPTSGDDNAFRTTFQHYAQGRSDRMFNALHSLLDGAAPQLNFVPSIVPVNGLSEVHLSATPIANKINVDPYAVDGIIDDRSAIHDGAVNQLPHEMAHLHQTTTSVPDREGGAQAFADLTAGTAADRAGIPYGSMLGFDGAYADYVKQANARGRNWVLFSQFGKPPTTWP